MTDALFVATTLRPSVRLVAAAGAGAGVLLLLLRALRKSLAGPPGPFPWPLVGQFFLNLPYINKLQQYKLFHELHQKYGDIFQISLNIDIISIADADAAKQILNTHSDFIRGDVLQKASKGILDHALFVIPSGDTWKKHRKQLQPAFGPNHLRHTVSVSLHVTDLAVASIRRRIADSMDMDSDTGNAFVVIDAYEYLTSIALEIIGQVAFSYEFGSIEALDQGKINEGRHRIERGSEIIVKRIAFPKFLWKWFDVGYTSPGAVEVGQYIRQLLLPMIAERRQHKAASTSTSPAGKTTDGKGRWDMDVLDRLLDQQGDGDTKFSDEEIMGEVYGLFLAGHETTASTMTFMMLALCQNPDVMQRLVTEIDDVYARLDGNVTIENLHEFRYLDNVLKETQRLYSVVVGVARKSTKPVHVMGYDFPAGTAFRISFEDLHRNPKYWKDPDTFNPDRWTTDTIVPGSFMPFGDGPRVCIGQKMAAIEIRVVILHLLRHFLFELVPGQVLEKVSMITAGLKRGLFLRVSERKLG